MADLAISIAAKAAEYMVGPTIHGAQYCCCFKTFAEDLADKKRKLESKRKHVEQRVKEATERNEKIENSVEEWLNEVAGVLKEVEDLERKIQARRCRSWLCGQCCHHNLAKKLAKMTEKMNKLSNENKFEPFSRPAGLRGIKYYSSKDFVYFKSTELAYNKLLVALQDDNNDVIGLYGMGGSGKTALVKEVGKKAEELQFFERAVIAVVSHTLNVRNIQDQLIDALGLKVEEQSNIYRAQRLSDRLRGSRTLIILDDVWEKLDFEQIGIPINDNKACRVLLTTRSHEVCSSMQCQKIVQLSLLTKEESWDFFKRCSGINEESDPAVKDAAKKVANKCRGLPIAITTVGSTLRGKSLDGWENALSRLERSHHLDVAKGMRNPYECIKLSYDNLTNQLAKSIFLLCSIFPEDSEIEVEDLVRFGKGLLPIKTIGISRSMEEARREITEAVEILSDLCLLLHTESKERVKVHDLVRDVALWIAYKDGQEVMVRTGEDPSILEEDETIQGKVRISLWDLKNPQPQDKDKSIKLPDQLIECPELDTLLLHSEDAGFEIPSSSFEGIGALKILAFIKFRYRWNMSMLRWRSKFTLSMLESIKFLTDLRTLCLRGYKLGDISVLESLSVLEILDLRGSSFTELPNGIAALKKLKLLDLFMCSVLKNNPYEVVGRCSTLEELYIWTDRDDSVENIFFPRLHRYAIVRAKTKVNYFESDLYNFLATHGPSRALCLENFDSSPLSFASSSLTKNLFQRAEGLYLQHLQGGYKNIIPNMDQRGMNQLIGLVLDSCLEIECLFDNTIDLFKGRRVFFKLVFLRVIKMEGLTKVFSGGASICTLEKLEELRIEDCVRLQSISFPRSSNLCMLRIVRLQECQKLRSVCTQSICQTLVMLEELRIRQCTEMKYVIADDELQERTAAGASTQTHSSRMFTHLRILDVQGCERLESIIPVTFAQGLVRLEEINMRKNSELKYVFGPHNSMDEIVIVTEIKLPALRTLRLKSLPKLIGICPEDTHTRSPIPKEFERIECPSLPPDIFMSMMQQEPATTMGKPFGGREIPDKGKELKEEGVQLAAIPKPGLLTRLCGNWQRIKA